MKSNSNKMGRPKIDRKTTITAWRLAKENNPVLKKAAFAKGIGISPRSFSRCVEWGIRNGILPKWALEAQPVRNKRQKELYDAKVEDAEWRKDDELHAETKAFGLQQYDSRNFNTDDPADLEPSIGLIFLWP